MTQVAPAAAAANPHRTATRTDAMVNYDAFLQLLVAQMRNQDPTQPTDSGEYLSQLAAFSGVEQAIQTNGKLDALMAQGALAQAGGLIGRTYASAEATGVIRSVSFADGTMTLVLDDGTRVRPGGAATIS